jgi:serine/threonine protein kinase
MFESQNYSAKFIDFLKECLMFDPKNRMKAFDILSHPVFRKYNKVYISQQIVMTSPITKVEKHNLQKLRCISRNL